ncbi:MAG: TIGR03663 family protein [Anaerolineales bacterium]|nr:TIGR03663 family protein [Anaerolineales bacterium]
MTETPIEKRRSWLDFPLSGIRWNTATLLTVILLVLAVVTRFYDLGARTASHDEINHFVPSYDLYQARGYRYDPLSHGPLQFHLIALSFALFGDSDFTARIPAALFSLATIGLALTAFRPYLGRAGALAAGALLLISPYMLFYGRYARNEIFIVLWGLLTIYTILRYLERGDSRTLILFTLVNALHFTDKATSYIFAAGQLIFLAVYFLYRIARREWPSPKYRPAFLLALSAMSTLLAAAAGLYLTGKPLASTLLTYVAALGLGGLLAGITAGIALVRGLGWGGIRSERAFDLLMLLGTLILPLLAGIPLKLAGFNPLDYSPAGIWRAVIAIGLLMVIAVLLGLWWKRRAWPRLAILFYGIFAILYTTFFTNPEGLAGGFMGALSYWLEQQTVNRGGQPWFYYGLFQIPLYEFLPALGTFAAVVIAFRKRLWQAQPAQPFLPAEGLAVQADASTEQRVPTLLLIIYWALSNLAAFTIAGEKMPWLTIHIALPLILAAAWAIGWLLETSAWSRASWNWKQDLRVVILTGMGILAVLTFRASFRAAYINYDNSFEYLVYAHAAPDPKLLLGEIEEISRRTTGGLDIVVAYDNNVRYPYWWYLRRYPKRIDFDVNPTNDLRRATLIVVSSASYDKIVPVLRDNYLAFDYNRMWWPNQDYWNLKWDWIENEHRRDLRLDAPPLRLDGYLLRVWGHLRPFFSDPYVRSAIWQIWFNRDYTQYAALKQSDAFTLTNWNTVERMRAYLRKDIAAQIWPHGLTAQEAVVADPYANVTVLLTPDQVIGAAGPSAGQFQSPRAIAIAPDGSLYVADSLNHRIQRLSPSGEVFHVWGQFGDAAQGDVPGGKFNEPWGVAVAPDGMVYVADTWNHRIQKFTTDGGFLSIWQTFGPAEEPDTFYGPRGIVVDAYGRVFVVDSGNKRVVVFDAEGGYLTQFGGAGLGPGQFDEPVGIAVDADGNVYVADTWNQRVQVFAPDASGLNYTPVAEWQVSGWYGQSLENKPFIAVDAQEHVYVTDPQACRVLEFTAGGQIVRAWGYCSSDINGFGLPVGLAVDSAGGVWVSDAGNDRLLHFP